MDFSVSPEDMVLSAPLATDAALGVTVQDPNKDDLGSLGRLIIMKIHSQQREARVKGS
jgi:hypothetical protein